MPVFVTENHVHVVSILSREYSVCKTTKYNTMQFAIKLSEPGHRNVTDILGYNRDPK